MFRLGFGVTYRIFGGLVRVCLLVCGVSSRWFGGVRIVVGGVLFVRRGSVACVELLGVGWVLATGLLWRSLWLVMGVDVSMMGATVGQWRELLVRAEAAKRGACPLAEAMFLEMCGDDRFGTVEEWLRCLYQWVRRGNRYDYETWLLFSGELEKLEAAVVLAA